ncbi:hypothetical protein BGX26_001899 [Mortierella sp. AD094]|nr:hypothetical protein BGX26_001899 [Mortierella sp. AD094]
MTSQQTNKPQSSVEPLSCPPALPQVHIIDDSDSDDIKDDSVILISSGDEADGEEDEEDFEEDYEDDEFDDDYRKYFGEPYRGNHEEDYYDEDSGEYDEDQSDEFEESLINPLSVSSLWKSFTRPDNNRLKSPVMIIDDDDDDDEQGDVLEALDASQPPQKIEDDDREQLWGGLDGQTKSPTQAICLSEEDTSNEKPQDALFQELASQGSVGVRAESPHEDYDYDADYLLGGEIEIQYTAKRKAVQDIDFVDLMNKSYNDSRSRPLTYQQEIEHQGKRRALLSGSFRRPRIQCPASFTAQEMQIIFACVGESTRALRQVDWDIVAREVTRSTGYQRSGDACLEAFEHAIGQYNKVPLRCQSGLTTLHSKISMANLLKMRESGVKQRHTFKDMLLLKQSRSYNCATSFNYASGSVVDMAFKTSTFKLAIANVATQDIYNRPGNLLLCDLDKGSTMQLCGHEQPNQAADQQLAVTVNDIKLSYSNDFFISGADDHKTMIWNAETGECLNVLEDYRSRVNRVAVLEDSQKDQDIFATCSEEGLINIYSLDEYGQVQAKNKQLVAPGGKRGISSISFGYGYFWDCLAAGMEGLDNGFNNDGLQGQVAFYDANILTRVAVGQLGFRHVSSGTTSRSVSCLSFSPSGKYLVCGTSGRTNAGDDEQGDGILRVFDVQHAKEIETALSGHEDVNLVEFSPCEQYIISCSNTNEVAVFDRRLLSQPLHRLCHQKRDHDSNAGITSALWWPSGLGTSQSMLVSGGGDGAVKLWDIRRAAEDAEVWSFDAKLGPIARMVSSAFFENLIVGGDTGAVSVFTLDHGIVSQYNERPMTLLSRDDE